MNKILEELEKNGVDVSATLVLFSGKESVYLSFLNRFIEDEQYRYLILALKEQRVADAFEAAHMWKSAAGNLGVTVLVNELTPMVASLRAGEMPSPDEISSLIHVYDKVAGIIRENDMDWEKK